MSNGPAPADGEYLAHRHAVSAGLKSLPPVKTILIVEDETPDAKRLMATLNILFSYEATIHQAQTLGKAVDAVMHTKFEIVFLDDYLKPTDRAIHTIPFLRRAGYTGPIVVVSGQLNKERRLELLAVGADQAVHKDDVDSARLGVVLQEVLSPAARAPTPARAVG